MSCLVLKSEQPIYNSVLKPLGGVFDLAGKQERITELEDITAAPEFWNNPEQAQRMSRELNHLHKTVEEWDSLQTRLADLAEFCALAAEDQGLETELDHELNELTHVLEQKEFLLVLDGKYDAGDAILAIHAGAGGTEAQDWAEMLLRMYLRWCDRRGFQSDIVDRTEGDTAGVKSVTVEVQGDFAYGYLRAEVGTHRLVRLSPFDAGNRRHTSFAKVEVIPSLTLDMDFEIKRTDLHIDTFRSSGAGGQHMQKNDTACRITHKPTGIVVSCQNERSLTQNKEQAMKVLRGKLYALEQEKLEAERMRLKGENIQADFGSQIRNYVLHPYNLVKDLRTQIETGKTTAVLDGDIDMFMEEWLKHQIGV